MYMNQDLNDYSIEPQNIAMNMDSLDKQILELLSEDGRKSYRKISRELGVSVGTIHNRVDKLTKSGIISKFVPVIDHEKLGYTLTAVIGIEIKGGTISFLTEKEPFKNNLLAVYDVTGQFDGIIIAKFKYRLPPKSCGYLLNRVGSTTLNRRWRGVLKMLV